MLIKVTTAALFMTILPLGVTFAAEPTVPQENLAKQPLTSDICEEIACLNKSITALTQDNEKNLSDLQTYLNNHKKIQKMRKNLKIDQNALETNINLVQTLSSHLIDNKLKITEDNSNSIKDLEEKLKARYKKFSNFLNYKDALSHDLRLACNNNTFKLDITPISFKYVDYQKASFLTIINELFSVNNYDSLNISIAPEIDADDIKGCLKIIHSFLKNITSHLAALTKIEAINSTHLEATKNILGMNIKTIDENQDAIKTLLGLK